MDKQLLQLKKEQEANAGKVLSNIIFQTISDTVL